MRFAGEGGGGGAERRAAPSEERSRRRRSRASENQRPYFERLDEVGGLDKGYVRRLELELEETKRICDESKRRLSALEYINEDLEKRLETEACRKLDLERELDITRDDAKREQKELQSKLSELEEALRRKHSEEEVLADKIRRLERELYRMHQKKHEMILEVRRQEAQERADDAEASQMLRAHAAAIESRGGESARGATGRAMGNSSRQGRQGRLQDEAMAVEYFSRPSPALAEEQNRFRMAQALGDFFQC